MTARLTGHLGNGQCASDSLIGLPLFEECPECAPPNLDRHASPIARWRTDILRPLQVTDVGPGDVPIEVSCRVCYIG